MTTNNSLYHAQQVKERLPAWLAHIKPEQLEQLRHLDELDNYSWVHGAPAPLQAELRRAQVACRKAIFALAKAMDGLLGATAFAEPLLRQRLNAEFGIETDLHRLKLARFSRDWNWMLLQTDLNHRVEPLLQAALQNFEASPVVQPETVVIDGEFGVSAFNGYPRYHFTPQPVSAAQFAALCHDLDLGQRYQDHLDEKLGSTEVRHCAIAARKAQFALDLAIARARGLDDDLGLGRVLEDAANDHQPAPACHAISLFGVTLHDALLICPANEPSVVFLHLPGMPHGALRRYETLAACLGGLIQRLCQPAFRQRLLGSIQHDQREHFASLLQHNLTGQSGPKHWHETWQAIPDASLHWLHSPIGNQPFARLHDAHHQRLLAEARLLAVPSRDADETARRQRLRYWESLGLDALGIAAFFLPAAGELMMLVFTSQLLTEVYEGAEAWHQGDIDTALDHLKAVALDVGVAVGTGIAIHYAAGLGKRLVEGLRPDGTPRLWNGDLTPWRTALPESTQASGTGLLTSGDQHYLSLDGSHYQVTRHPDGKRWSILHPTDPAALRPVLEHNGHGTWHGAHEQPLEWSRRTLLQRLGEPVAGYSAEELEIASHVCAIRRDELLDVYLKHRPAPPRLLATLGRLRTDTAAEDPLEALVEGLYHPQRMTRSSERLTLLQLPRQAGWPSDCTLELRVGNRSGPLLERAGERFAKDRRLIVKVHGGYRTAQGENLGPAIHDDFFAALVEALPELGADTFALKTQIAEHAQQTPEATLSRVWSGHSETWRDDGRLLGGFDKPAPAHYPVAREPRDPLVTRYRRLFPAATDQQAMSELGEWYSAGRPAHLQLRALEQQLDYLRTVLGQWAGEQPGRGRVHDHLIASWQQNLPLTNVLDMADFGLTDFDFSTFPHLADAFGHVEELHLTNNAFLALPDLLVRQLPNLHTLLANSMSLSHLPGGLGSRIRALELSDNRITWSDQSQAALAGYPQLEYLDLSGNPLLAPPDLGDVTALRSVNLFDTNLGRFPTGLEQLSQLEYANLSSNQIVTLPPLGLSRATQQALAMEHNPLDETSIALIELHYRETGIDLLVSEDDYTSLLQGADVQTEACWERLSRKLPLRYRRDLRGIADKPAYIVAPTTTRRRFWTLLAWLDSSPQGLVAATAQEAGKLLLFELFADLHPPQGFIDARHKTMHYLQIAVMATRYQAVGEALWIKFPGMTNQQYEALRALALQRVSRDPRLQLFQAPKLDEPVHLIDATHLAPLLDAQWIETLQNRLLHLNGTTQDGRDALLAEGPTGESLLLFWVKRLEERYTTAFDDLQDYASRQLEDAEARLSEGDYLLEADHLRRQLEVERRSLLERLTRQIAEGTQADW